MRYLHVSDVLNAVSVQHVSGDIYDRRVDSADNDVIQPRAVPNPIAEHVLRNCTHLQGIVYYTWRRLVCYCHQVKITGNMRAEMGRAESHTTSSSGTRVVCKVKHAY